MSAVLTEIRRGMKQHNIAPNHDSDPPLHQAAFYGNYSELVRLLKEEGKKSKLNYKNRLGCTPLRLAATVGNAKCVEYMISWGADVDVIDLKGQTPLYVAVKNKHLPVIQDPLSGLIGLRHVLCYVSWGPLLSGRRMLKIYPIICHNKILLAAGANPDGDLQCLSSPIYTAAFEGFLSGIQALVQFGADLNNPQMTLGSIGSTPLHISLSYHHLECFRELLISGADPDIVVKHKPADGRPRPVSSLYHSVIKHNVEVEYAELLYMCGAGLYYPDDNGKLPCGTDTDNECSVYIKTLYSEFFASAEYFASAVYFASKIQKYHMTHLELYYSSVES